MVAYWHGDGYCTQLVLREIAKMNRKIKVIVTAHWRGDVIEKMIRRHGAEAIRLPDGFDMRPFLKELKESSKKSGHVLAGALDGPLGPLHEPKKLLFLLASEAGKEACYIRFYYSRVIHLKKRWDRYVIPLPFSKIIADVEDLGVIGKEQLRHFDEFKRRMLPSEG